jgi:hypothetical protein
MDIKQLIVFLKKELKKINNNVFYGEIDKTFKNLYPVIVFNLDYNLVNNNRINVDFNINLYTNNFNNVLIIEQLTQDIYNYFNYYRVYTEENGVKFSVLITNINVQNAPTQEENLKRKLINITAQVQFK